MTTPVQLDVESEQLIEEIIATGYFATRDDVLRQGVRLVREQVDHPKAGATMEPLDPELIALLERRIAESDAHPDRNIPAGLVFAEMERRCLEEMARFPHAAE